MDAPAPLEIHLLGGFHVAVQGRVLPADAWRQRRPAAVVKLLALAPAHRLHREQLIETLWPEFDGEAAANNLRVAVHRARRRFEDAGAQPDRFLVRDGEDVLLAAVDTVLIDVGEYEAAVARAWLTDDPAASREALNHYSGDLLPEDLYADWAANRRSELRTSYLTLLARLAQLHEQRDELGRAIATLQRLLSAEPLDEPAHTALIRLFARGGETRQATTQYERLVELLDQELGTEPDPSTRELIAAIREGRFPAQTQPFEPVATSGRPPEAPSSPTPRHPVSSLPAPLEDLIGRDREIAELRRLMTNHRLVTLTGPAGVGKTRLALAVAHSAAGAQLEGVYFADLTPLRDPDLVLPAIARAFGAQEEGDRPLLNVVAAHLGDERVLLVLDNFEQVAAAAPVVAGLLASCAGLTLLVTSRGRLRLHGEQEYPVQPLAAPERTAALAERVDPVASPAVALFVRRASETQPGFALTAEDAEAVAELCRRLDGLPLAIELAAARVRILPPVALLERLERPLTLLTGGTRDAPERHRTLHAAIAWSHDLLQPAEQTLFAHLAVFVGGFTLEAAEVVGGRFAEGGASLRGERGEEGGEAPPLDSIAVLVEQSLVRRQEDVDGEPRFAMLETIREYAVERLEASGEMDEIRSRHASFFLALAERAEPELNGPAAATWFASLESDHDNVRAALTTLSANGASLDTLRLAGALGWFWWLRGYLSEGRTRLEQALAAATSAPASVRARALDSAGALATAQGDLVQASGLHDEALRLWREAGDGPGEVRALINLGLVADEQGDPQRAAESLQEALALARAAGNRRSVAVALANLGQVAMTLADHQQAASLLGESVALFRELGDQRSQSAILANLGVIAFLMGDFAHAKICHEEALTLLGELQDRQGVADELLNLGHTVQRLGDLPRARALFDEARDGYEALGDRSGTAFALNHLGRLEQRRGNVFDAESLLRQGLALGQQSGDQVAVAEALEGLALVACTTGEATQGAHFIGAAEALREAIGVPLPEVHRADYLYALAEGRRALGEHAFSNARSQGRAIALERAATTLPGLLAGDVVDPTPSTSG